MPREFPKIENDRLLLRQIIESDLENIFTGLSHPDIIKYYGIRFDSLEATKQQMTWFTDLEKNGSGIWWAVCAKEDQAFLGACGFNNLNKEHKKAEIGFWLLPAYWGKGIITEAVHLIVDYAFNNLGLQRIEGFVETENKNSKKVLARLNFNHEKTLQDYEEKNGKLISLDIYTKIKNT
jgi:ribosomal-protein-alanine N-acetyltransferase